MSGAKQKQMFVYRGVNLVLILIFIGIFRKLNILGGMKILLTAQNWTIFIGHFYAF